MKENVLNELQHMRPDDETKKKMMDILKRFHSEEESESMDEDRDDDDDNDITLSEETIQKVLSGSEVSFDDLSAEEKKLFQRAIASGELSKMIAPWDPWWLNPAARTIRLRKDGTTLIQPVSNQETSVSKEDDGETNQSSSIPCGPEAPLPSLDKLISTEPSPLLAVHFVDIIYSYCFTLRLYNGDWQSDALGAASVVLSVSSVLGQVGQPETVLEALSYCLEQTCSPAFRHMGGVQFGLAVIDDVVSLLSLEDSALICMLCDLQRLIKAGERELKSEKSRKAEIKRKLKCAERKVYFMMCWVHEQTGEAWAALAGIVKAEKNSAMNFESYKNTRKMENKKGKVLIEEMK